MPRDVHIDGRIVFRVNGHELRGRQVGDGWEFDCPSWPEIADRWSGDAVPSNAVNEFFSRALVGQERLQVMALIRG